MDAQDRHVLAAELSADADILLTDIARHRMAARYIELLIRLAGEFLDRMLAAHQHRVLLPDVRSVPYSSRPRRGWQNFDIAIPRTSAYFQGSCTSTGRRLQSWNGREMSE